MQMHNLAAIPFKSMSSILWVIYAIEGNTFLKVNYLLWLLPLSALPSQSTNVVLGLGISWLSYARFKIYNSVRVSVYDQSNTV